MLPIRKKCGRVEGAGKFSTKFSGLSETVPDTHVSHSAKAKKQVPNDTHIDTFYIQFTGHDTENRTDTLRYLYRYR